MATIFFKLVYEKGELTIDDVPAIWRADVEKKIKAAERARAKASS